MQSCCMNIQTHFDTPTRSELQLPPSDMQKLHALLMESKTTGTDEHEAEDKQGRQTEPSRESPKEMKHTHTNTHTHINTQTHPAHTTNTHIHTHTHPHTTHTHTPTHARTHSSASKPKATNLIPGGTQEKRDEHNLHWETPAKGKPHSCTPEHVHTQNTSITHAHPLCSGA